MAQQLEGRVDNLEENFDKAVKQWRIYRQSHQERHQRLMVSLRATLDELYATMDNIIEREAEQDAILDKIIETIERR